MEILKQLNLTLDIQSYNLEFEHFFEQYLTSFQFFSHFFLHVKFLLHTGHSFDGKKNFFIYFLSNDNFLKIKKMKLSHKEF